MSALFLLSLYFPKVKQQPLPGLCRNGWGRFLVAVLVTFLNGEQGRSCQQHQSRAAVIKTSPA